MSTQRNHKRKRTKEKNGKREKVVEKEKKTTE
jgi:hypothetical protein